MERRLGIFEIITLISGHRKAVTIGGKEFLSDQALIELTKLADFSKSAGIQFYFAVTEGEYYYHLNQCGTYP